MKHLFLLILVSLLSASCDNSAPEEMDLGTAQTNFEKPEGLRYYPCRIFASTYAPIVIYTDAGKEIPITFAKAGSNEAKLRSLLGLGGRPESATATALLDSINSTDTNSLFVGGYFNGHSNNKHDNKEFEFCLKDWFVCTPIPSDPNNREQLTEQDFHPDANPDLKVVQRRVTR